MGVFRVFGVSGQWSAGDYPKASNRRSHGGARVALSATRLAARRAVPQTETIGRFRAVQHAFNRETFRSFQGLLLQGPADVAQKHTRCAAKSGNHNQSRKRKLQSTSFMAPLILATAHTDTPPRGVGALRRDVHHAKIPTNFDLTMVK